MFQCLLLSHVPACASVYLDLKCITDRCGCFQAWSSTLCAVNEFICIVLPLFYTTPFCIFIKAEVPNIQPVFGSRRKKAPFLIQFVLFFPNDFKFPFIYTITITNEREAEERKSFTGLEHISKQEKRFSGATCLLHEPHSVSCRTNIAAPSAQTGDLM